MKTEKKRKTAFPAFLILISSFLLCTCASLAAEKQPFTYLTDRAKFVLLPHTAIENPMDTSQFISASYGGQNYHFYAWVRADETGMDMSIFNELGASMGELSYKDSVINFSSRVLPEFLKPEYIVADFQLCYYDPVLLAQALKKCGLALELKGSARRIFNGKNLIIEIERTNNAVRLVNHLRGYTYAMELSGSL